MDNSNYFKKELIFFYKKVSNILYINWIYFNFVRTFLRSVLIELDQNKLVYNFIPLILGIFYAFYLNIKINFFVQSFFKKIIDLFCHYILIIIYSSKIITKYSNT